MLVDPRAVSRIALGSGHVWQFATYAFVHVSLMHLVWVAVPLVAFARVVEPRLGHSRAVILIGLAAVFAGIAYSLLGDIWFVGGAFVVHGFGAAFVTLWFFERRSAPRWYIVLVVASLIYAALSLLSPVALSVPCALAWIAGVGVVAQSHGGLRRSTSS